MREMRGLIVVACLATCASCITFHGPKDLQRDLVQATGVELERESGVTVGRMGVMLARWFTPEKEIPLKGVRRVQVGVYEVTDFGEGDYGQGSVEPPELPGWETVVRVHEEDENVFVMLHQEEDQIRGMLVVVMERDEWVLVRIKGKLNRTVERAMQMAFEEADRPELYDPALTAYRESGAEDRGVKSWHEARRAIGRE
ncbi:MAG: DUF4252 domain-containing protein [Planctomycetota bacterium]|jgi:hypothetical protein